MKKHHEVFHAHETIKNYNYIASIITDCLFFLKSQSSDGIPLSPSPTLDELKSWILGKVQNVLATYSKIDKFVKGHEVYDLTQHSNKTRDQIISDKLSSDGFSTNIQTGIGLSSVNTKTKLANISIVNPLVMGSPIVLYPSIRYVCILNDFLDSTDYVCRGIDPNSGTPLTATDNEKKAMIQGYLNQFGNYSSNPWPSEFISEVNLMYNVKDWILGNLNSSSFTDISTHINSQVTKLPLMRRNWAI